VRAGDDATWDWSEAKLGDAARQCGSRLKSIPAKVRSTDRSWNSRYATG